MVVGTTFEDYLRRLGRNVTVKDTEKGQLFIVDGEEFLISNVDKSSYWKEYRTYAKV